MAARNKRRPFLIGQPRRLRRGEKRLQRAAGHIEHACEPIRDRQIAHLVRLGRLSALRQLAPLEVNVAPLQREQSASDYCPDPLGDTIITLMSRSYVV